MRRKIVAGNWKMNNDLNESRKLITEIIDGLSKIKAACDVIICPPFTSLSEASGMLINSPIKLGAQNMYFEASGAFTGEISAAMLKSAGCNYVILGHSERRTIFGESDGLINKKLKTALSYDLLPIFCIGETLQERESDIMEEVVKRQLVEGLKGIPVAEMGKIIVAYEPVWAIGTGRTATPKQAQEVHNHIRTIVKKLYSEEIASALIIQYGGSVKPDNAADLLSQPDIDGALVGGACLKADSFIGIIQAA